LADFNMSQAKEAGALEASEISKNAKSKKM
jgi:hypothetical protein